MGAIMKNGVNYSGSGGGSGTTDYEDLTNKPSINNVALVGNKTTSDLGITVPTKTSDLTNDSGFITSSSVPTKTSDLTNDSGFITSSSVPDDLNDLTDVNISNPSADQVLKYDSTSSKWINATNSGGKTYTAGDGINISNQDVISTDNMQSGDMSDVITPLPAPITEGHDLGDIEDVTITSPTDGQVLTYDATNDIWKNASGGTSITSLGDIADVDLTNLADGQTIKWDATNSKWVNAASGGSSSTWKSATLSAGSTSVTFTGLPTSGNYAIGFYTSTGINYSAISTASGSATLTFAAQSSAVTVYCEIQEIK